MYYRFNCL